MNTITNKQPLVIPISQGKYEVVELYHYTYTYNDRTFRINIPKGFEFDGASIPRVFWSVLGLARDGYHRAAALVHDYIYHYDGDMPTGSVSELKGDSWQPLLIDIKYTRKEADKLFCRVLREFEVKPWKRKAMYYAVRLFGHTKWR